MFGSTPSGFRGRRDPFGRFVMLLTPQVQDVGAD
jgi:hypothetical protein